MNTYEPPRLPVAGSTLHRGVVEALAARGITEATRHEYLVEAARQHGTDYVDPLDRPLAPSERSPWAIRRARDNQLALLAGTILERDGIRTPTREQYLDAVERAETKTQVRYRDDHRQEAT